MPHKRLFLACLAGFVCAVLLENIPAADRAVQDLFFSQGHWLITKADHARLKALFYTGPKVAIGIIGGICLAMALVSFLRPALRARFGAWPPFFLLLGCSILCVPLVAAGLKAVTGVHGPLDLIPYGGEHPHIGLLSQLLHHGAVGGGRDFPAGHASGGFALTALWAMPTRRVWRALGLGIGLSAGWSMGLYQMARGEHFLSHTLATMFLAGCIIALLWDACAAVAKRGGFLRCNPPSVMHLPRQQAGTWRAPTAHHGKPVHLRRSGPVYNPDAKYYTKEMP